jgi:hypothetical protein
VNAKAKERRSGKRNIQPIHSGSETGRGNDNNARPAIGSELLAFTLFARHGRKFFHHYCKRHDAPALYAFEQSSTLKRPSFHILLGIAERIERVPLAPYAIKRVG